MFSPYPKPIIRELSTIVAASFKKSCGRHFQDWVDEKVFLRPKSGILGAQLKREFDMAARSLSVRKIIAAVFVGAALLAGCQQSDIPKHMKPVTKVLTEKMQEKNMSETAPIFIRIFKESSELEIWKKQRGGKYALLQDYHVCKWSGALGPKKAEGDRQAPEGFYAVTPAQMNPKSKYYLSFNIGYPNSFDRALERTGTHLMVHGACSSAGCYSMTNDDAGELFGLARDSFRGGQRAFQIQALPFRMTAENLARHRNNENFDFWKMLKTGSDHFELTHQPPKVDVCDKRYVFNADAEGRKFSPSRACPSYKVNEELEIAVAEKQAADEIEFAEAVARLAVEAETADEEQRLAESLRVVAEAEAAEKLALKEARATKISKNIGVFGRLFGRDKKTSEPEAVIAPPLPNAALAETPVIAVAPPSPSLPPVPTRRPKTPPVVTASAEPAQSVNATPPSIDAPIAEIATKATITPVMRPGIASVETVGTVVDNTSPH